MGSFADYLENKLLDHVFGGGDYARPATLYIGLSTTTVTDAGGNVTEPVGNNYARAPVTNNAVNFPAAVNGAKTNGADISFNVPSGAWGTVTDFVIYDAAAAGNVIATGVLGQAQPIVSGNPVKFVAGQLSFSLA